jgi:mono/diheme cytochrome c family protein
MGFLKHAAITVLLAALLGIATAAWVISGGHFDVSVAAQLPRPVHDLVHLTRVNAVKREVRDLEAQPADLDDRSRLLQAVALFQADCSGCHQPPEQAPPALARNLNPPPADLTEAAEKRSLEELFWVSKHGIRMSAMPAWGRSRSDTELWAVATLIQRFPQMSGAQYRALLEQARSAEKSRAQ